jgi:hypothetical protein
LWNVKWLLLAHWQRPLEGSASTVTSIVLDEAVPENEALALHDCPVSVICVIVNVPVIDDAGVNVRRPAAPPTAVQFAMAVELLCVTEAVTVSVTFVPAVTYCQVPDQDPDRSGAPLLGDEGEPPQAAAATSATASPMLAHPWTARLIG